MRLIFVRHGDPDYANDSLTERGRKEVEALLKRAKNWKVDRFYSSPLGRARETAKPILEYFGAEAEVHDWLREFYADVIDPQTGKRRIPWDLMPAYWTNEAALYNKDGWTAHPLMRTGDVEKEYARVCNGLDGILSEYGYIRKDGYYITGSGNRKTLVFFCHLGVQLVMLSHLFGVSAPIMWQNFFVAPSSVTELVTEERVKGEATFRCKRLGDISHLYAENILPSDSGFFCEVYEG